MRAASSGSLVPAIGFADGAGDGVAAGADWACSGEEELAVVVETGVLDVWGVVAAGDTMTTAATGEPEIKNHITYSIKETTETSESGVHHLNVVLHF